MTGFQQKLQDLNIKILGQKERKNIFWKILRKL